MQTRSVAVRLLWCAVAVAGVVAATPAHGGAGAGAAEGRVSLLAGGGAWVQPEAGGHGLLLVAYERDGLPRQGRWLAELNTDTLRLHAEGFRFFGGRLQIGARAAAEAVFAGLLPDYYREGVRDPARGFSAHYAGLAAHAKVELPGYQYVELELGGRRWAFDAAEDTSAALILPAPAWVAEPRLHYTLWRLQDDRSLRDRHRAFPRVRGLALGGSLGVDLRSDAHDWGALDPEVFVPADPRNTPGARILLARQWLQAGWQAHPRLRLQLQQSAAWGEGEDDLTRQRLGGLNPYVVPLPGAPWAALLSGRFVGGGASVHLRVGGDVEVGPMVAGAWMQDPERLGATVWGAHWGVGGFADLRLGAWQIDLRAGWSPTVAASATPGGVGLYLAAGWAG